MARDLGRFRRLTAVIGAVVTLIGCGSLIVAPPSSRGALRPGATAAPPDCAGSSSLFGFTGHAKVISQIDVPVCVTGQVTVTFAGDQATGCAAEGVCAYRGTETWEPEGIGDIGLLTVAQNGHRSTSATLSIGGLVTPVLSSVQRTGVTGSTVACSDSSQILGGFFTLRVHGGQVDVGLDHAEQSVFGTRCAGPLDVDLLGALAHKTVSLARLRRGDLTIDLSGSAPFAAAGFSGTVDSSVKLALGRPRVQSQHPSPVEPPTRETSVRYRVTHAAGKATATVRTTGAAATCSPLDACGVRGTIFVTPHVHAGDSVFLTATSLKPRSEHDLLSALGLATGGDTSGITIVGGGDVAKGGAVTAELTQDGSACTDQVTLQQTEILMRKRTGRLRVFVTPVSTQAADPLRTRCPGPALGHHLLTSTSLPLSVLRRGHFSVRLHGVSFHDGPYDVTTHSTLTVSLERGRVTTQLLPFVSRSRTG